MKEYTYSEAIDYLENMPHFVPPKDGGLKKDFFSLDAELALLEKLGKPQNDLKYVHIAGTNGKGSTTTYLASILKEASVVTGAFTSPYLYRYNEMYKVMGEDISDEDFAHIFSIAKEKFDELAKEDIHPSEYELLTAMAFVYFKEKGSEIVLLEVSMGGRVDTTNVIPSPLVTIITPISYDHMTILGNTLTEIATEKAGIIKNGTVVISAPQELEVQAVLNDSCASNSASILYVKEPLKVERSLQGQQFIVEGTVYNTSLLGNYQVVNGAVAIAAAYQLETMGYHISAAAIQSGIKKAKWFGRFTLLQNNPPVIIDGGHNRQGAAVLRQSLETYFPGKKITFILGILKDKEVDLILDELLPLADRCYTHQVPSPRTMPPQELAQMIEARGVKAQVLDDDQIKQVIGESEVVCIAGSLYLISVIERLT